MLNLPKSDETHTEEDATLAPESEPQTVKALPESLQLLRLVGTDECPFGPGGKWHGHDKKKFSVLFITQQAFYDGYGDLLTEERIKEALAPKGMTEWAYILHDRDAYTPKDFRSNYKPPKGAAVGDKKPAHWHIVIFCKSRKSIAEVAKAFGVQPQYVEGKPPSAFLPLCKYLTHEDPAQADKETYDRSEVITNVARLWEKVDEHEEKRAKRQVDEKDVFKKVSDGELTLADVREEYPDIYVKKGNLSHMRILRNDYISRLVPPSKVMNFYICGDGGKGKDAAAVAIAKALAALFGWRIFKVGADNVTFENYDGEEIIIWEDKRAASFIHACGGRGDAFRVLGPYRKDTDHMVMNVKNSKVTLVNHVNIITAVTPYREFISGLAGTYKDRYNVEQKAEDEGQAYRRIQIVIEVERGSYTIHVNKGFALGTGDYFDYFTTPNLAQNFEQLYRDSEHIRDEEERINVVGELSTQTVAPVIDEFNRLMNRADSLPEMTADELRVKYAHLGTQPQPTSAEELGDFASSRYIGVDFDACSASDAFNDDFTVMTLRNSDKKAVMTVFRGTIPQTGEQVSIAQLPRENGCFSNYRDVRVVARQSSNGETGEKLILLPNGETLARLSVNGTCFLTLDGQEIRVFVKHDFATAVSVREWLNRCAPFTDWPTGGAA